MDERTDLDRSGQPGAELVSACAHVVRTCDYS